MVEISEKMLAAAATWPVVHEAKKLREGGRVSRAAYDAPLLRGVVREGTRSYAAGLKIFSATDVENLCSCKLARTLGKICAHSVAVALEVLHGPSPKIHETVSSWAENLTTPTEGNLAVTFEGSLQGLEAMVEADDETARVTATGRLEESGFTASRGRLTLTGQDAVLAFLAEELPALPKSWQIRYGERFASQDKALARVGLRGTLVHGPESGWLRLHCEAVADGFVIPWEDVQKAKRSGQKTIVLPNGKRALLNTSIWSDFDETLRDSDVRTEGPQSWLVPHRQSEFVRAGLNAWSGGQDTSPARKEIPLGALGELLRPYQTEGVYWLVERAESVGGAILADDMGLGKTVQTLAALKYLGGPSLVVCPASLAFNWRAEAERFWPGVKVVSWIGPDRVSSQKYLEVADLVITNYALLRNDRERLSSICWKNLVLDEAQHIKNPGSQNAETAKALGAQFRLALTGTPLENTLRDLWSLGDFVVPGYLGTASHFGEAYEKPITQTGDRQAMKRLKRKLHPLLLRRTKAEVLTELPPKIEYRAYCVMGEDQERLYRKTQQEGWLAVESLDPKKQLRARKMAMLTLLLRLRQICCDPALLPGDSNEEPSAKVELLRELLEEAVDAGHRTLVFSQFSQMLRRLQKYANQWGLPSCLLDGQTKDRQREIKRFKTKPDIPIFFISLKAGGIGLNLPEADHVIHFDPWWNPAAEDQATDRAHRMGQKEVVLSRKLIVTGTVEEKIIQLQTAKRAQITDFLSENMEPESSLRLTNDQLSGLLQPHA